MKEYQSLCHPKLDCKYHVVFIPKRRKKMIFVSIRKHLGGTKGMSGCGRVFDVGSLAYSASAFHGNTRYRM